MRRVAHLSGSPCARSLKAPVLAEGDDGVTCRRCLREVRRLRIQAQLREWREMSEQSAEAAGVIGAAFPGQNLATVARCLVAVAKAHPEEMEKERVLVALSPSPRRPRVTWGWKR